MPRVARVVIADVAHHVTQRGNGRQFILASDAERLGTGTGTIFPILVGRDPWQRFLLFPAFFA